MKIRMMGISEECARAVAELRRCPGLNVLEVSSEVPNRGDSKLVRVYVEVGIVHGTSGGVHVTDAVTEACAAEAEAGHDLDQLTSRRPGGRRIR